ncbi:lisH domain-containing protein C1711.05-like [Pistacia vera]|uniref:lisH domain-containing protein C1711.05-like n=1 Tax=Pistacia vera TaxID=55513 RepID=UPI0012631BAC|nr:lisH domain-containing protein C1711.05-like [Pistacia vera]
MGGFLSSTTSTTTDSQIPSSSSSFSSPSSSSDSQNPNSSANSLNPKMPSSDNNQPLKQTPESSNVDSRQTLESKPQNPDSRSQSSSIDTKIEKTQEEKEKETVIDNGEEIEGEGAEEEEEGECGFCLFMKGGGCKESFIAWENCVEESEKNKEDVVEKCFEVTSTLRKCMEAHADYYEPILRAEKAAQEEAVKELEKEKAAEDSKDSKGNGDVGRN